MRILNKRIPTILGIGMIVLAIIFTTVVAKNQTDLSSKASNSEAPQNIKFTNISNDSFTLIYQTDAPATGSISYGHNKNLGESELEDVDKEKGSFSPKKIHSMSVKQLTPATKYYLAIISGTGTFLNNGSPFEATTGPDISSSSAKQKTITGKIILPNGNVPSEALVYLDADNSQLLSSAVDKNGKFNFFLKDLRTNDLSSYFNTKENTVFRIVALGDSLKSTVLVSSNKIDSIPTITLSNDYDFAEITSPVATKSAESSGFPTIAPPKNNTKPQIISPKEKQSFNSQKPQFRGTSLPNEKVEIIIHSDEQITTSVTADNNGNWTYSPPQNLSSGDHTITIKTRDSSGILTTIMQSFTVFATEATPTLAALPTLTPIPTPTIILIPTATPIIIPTVTPTPFPTLAPIIQSKGGLPPTGNPPILLIAGGIIATIAGVALFLLTHGIL